MLGAWIGKSEKPDGPCFLWLTRSMAIQSAAFRPGSLKLHDGPGICYARLKLELDGETQESRAEAHLSLGKRDIQEYSEQHYPRKPQYTKHHRSADPYRIC